MADNIRFGVLGAARITKQALVTPASAVPGAQVYALAARDPARAREQATKLNIPKVHESYDALLADPDIDAVYVPLPNSFHAEWSIKALEAGKHVLCEKPISSNADEAQKMADVAEQAGLVLAEAMHSRYHALTDRIAEVLESGVLGEVRHVEAQACFIIANGKDIRWQYDMGGGALMDLGVYAVAVMRSLIRAEPVEVTWASAKVAQPNVDRWIDARFRFETGATGRVLTSMWGWPIVAGDAWIEGDDAKIVIKNPYGPQLFNAIEIHKGGKRVQKESVAKLPTSYEQQLRAFVDGVRDGKPVKTGPKHFIPNMKVIDAIYRKAGLPPRGTRV